LKNIQTERVYIMEKFDLKKEIGDRIRKIRGKQTQEEFAHKLGIHKDQLSRYERGVTLPRSEILDRIGEFGQITTDVLPAHYFTKGEGEFAYIPWISGKISAGGGLIPDSTVEFHLAFRRDWITRKGDPSRMSLIKIRGDSMTPTLLSGDIVLVDQCRQCIDPEGGLYALSIDDTIMVKRVQLLPQTGKLKVSSDNTYYDSFELEPSHIRVNGKIIWFARELEK
jgi:phage repressor protein C with HTH and peptisase S24 domain